MLLVLYPHPACNYLAVTLLSLQLEIIEEGLQLKLEIQGIKEQFLSLLNNFDEFDNKDSVPSEVMTPKPSTAQKGISSARARVRALYEARKARLAAKRAASRASDDRHLPPSKYAKVDHNDNKENVPSPRVSRESRRRSSSAATTPFAKSHGNCACHPRSVLKKLLTPIKEERQDQCLKCSQKCASKRGAKTSTARGLEGEYVILQSPVVTKNIRDIGDYVTLASSPLPPTPFQTPVANLCNTPNDTSIWDETMQDVANRSDITVELSSQVYSSPERPTLCESPVKYAKSDDIAELYTTKSPRDLRDVSLINKISRTSLREQVSSCNLSGAFHSTFNYPLHSTLNYPVNSTMDLSDIVSQPGNHHNGRTTVSSDPSSIPRASDSDSGDSEPTRTLVESNNNSDSFVTPVRNLSQMKKPQLCKEHGMHPTFGGPCIFQNEDSIVNSSDDDEDDNDSETHQKTVIETDCDSSYLSECVDDVQLSQAEDYMPMYDARSGHMRMLKRQTGHIQLKNVRNTNWDPIGLSESDIMLDMSRKHHSMEATRASIADVSALSTPMLSDDELTINAGPSQCKGRGLSPNSTLISLDARPLSVSTTDESPESTSTHGLPVPLNSPNITTSGSSSSRPNTDNYDYADMSVPAPPQVKSLPLTACLRSSKPKKSSPLQSKSESQFLVPAPPKPLLPKCPTSSTSRHRHQSSSKAQSCHDTKSMRSVKSARSMQSVPNMPMRGSSQRNLRHDCDSGFSTQGSRPRRRHALAASSHFTISDNTGVTRTVVQHSAVARNLQHDRKKQIVKKLKQFNNNFHKEKSTGNLHIETLGHF